MSLYRKVSVRVWGDVRFRRLSPLNASAQGLWFFLLTGPHTTALPGLSRASSIALADELGWPPEDFRRCFAELETEGMAKADWAAKLVWLPNAIRHNEPENPNVLKHWGAAWDLLPECALKSEAFRSMESYCQARGELFTEAFAGRFKAPSEHAPTNVPPNVPETLGQTTSKSVAVAVAETGAVVGGECAPEPPAPPSPSEPLRQSRKPSEQQAFASWFEEKRKQALGSAWTEDTHLGVKRLNTELEWVKTADMAVTQDAVQLFLEDPKRQHQDPPFSLLWFSRDRATYLSKAKRGAA